MAITQAVCNSFKRELLVGLHNFTISTGGVFKIALYTSSSSLSASTVTYADGTATNEVSATGYTAGGQTLTNVTPTLSSSTGITDFDPDITWTSSTITARGALIYNSSTTGGTANRAIVTLNFGSDKSSAAGDFGIVFPTADASNAIIRIV